MFVTAMAANPLAVNLAADALGQTISWGLWAKTAIVPGVVALLTMPLILYVLYPPEKKETPNAPVEAAKQLEKLGPMSTDEEITAAAFAVTVGLWIGGAAIGVNAVAAALVGLSGLLITGVVSWKECLSNNGAWDTLTWFAALIAMASHLNKFGFIPWFSDKVQSGSLEIGVWSSQHYWHWSTAIVQLWLPACEAIASTRCYFGRDMMCNLTVSSKCILLAS
jgi:anion transporter